MKMRSVVRAFIAAAALSVLAAKGVHAQEVQKATPRAFYISEFVVTDR